VTEREREVRGGILTVFTTDKDAIVEDVRGGGVKQVSPTVAISNEKLFLMG
jgi:hypothetical protein